MGRKEESIILKKGHYTSIKHGPEEISSSNLCIDLEGIAIIDASTIDAGIIDAELLMLIF